MNRTLQELPRSILSHADLPNGYWAYAISIVAYKQNNIFSSPGVETPYEMWLKKPNIRHLRVLSAWHMLIFEIVKDNSWTREGKETSVCWLLQKFEGIKGSM